MEEYSNISKQPIEVLKAFYFTNITEDNMDNLQGFHFPNVNITEDLMEKLQRAYAVFSIYLLSIYVITIIPAVFGNSLILVSLFRFRRLRSRVNILIGNLAVSDLLLGLIAIPFDIVFLHVQTLQEEKFPCLFRQTLNVTLFDASIMGLFCISLERYIAIVHPLKHAKLCRKKRLFILLGICWSMAIIIGTIPLMGWNKWEQGMLCLNELVWHGKYKGIQYFTICSFMTTNFIMYVKVMRTAWRRHKQTRLSGTSDTHSQRHISISQKDVRKTKIMVLVLGIFAFCWGPYCIMIIAETFFVHKNIKLIIVRKFFGCLGMLNSGLNWIVYGVKNKNFRQAFKYLLSFGACSHKEGYDLSTTK